MYKVWLVIEQAEHGDVERYQYPLSGEVHHDVRDALLEIKAILTVEGNDTRFTVDADLRELAENPPTERIMVAADGACKGNPGPGGWGYVIEFPTGERRKHSGGHTQTTSPRMELMAATVALENLSHVEGVGVTLTTDCMYVKKGITEWISGWRRRNWRTTNGGDVKHRDLWERLDKVIQGMDVEFEWVKGHSGHELNEIADTLAQGAAEKSKYGNHS